jgi:uncharacterized membrane protein
VRFLAKYFFRGMLFVVPVAATLYVAWSVLRAVDELVKIPERWAHIDVPGMGIVVAVTLMITIGYLASHFFTKRIARLIQRWMQKLPLLKMIYGSIRDLVGAFVGDKKSFEHPVLATLAPGVRVFGFVTREDLALFGCPGHVAVYVPQSYNFAANLIVVPNSAIEPVDTPASEVMTFIVSGGISGPGAALAADESTVSMVTQSA